MTNSTLLTGALVFAFILFLATRKRLALYTSVLWGSANTAPATASGSPNGSGNAAQPGTGVSSPTSPVASPPSVSSVQTGMQKAFGSLFMPDGNGTAGLPFSDALQTAAGMMAPAGMLGF